MKTIDITIEGMHCNGCVQRATDALKKVPGTTPQSVTVGNARVQIDESKTTPAALVAALENLGFDARITQGG